MTNDRNNGNNVRNNILSVIEKDLLDIKKNLESTHLIIKSEHKDHKEVLYYGNMRISIREKEGEIIIEYAKKCDCGTQLNCTLEK